MSGNHFECPPYARMDFLQNYRPPATGNITFLFTLEDTSGALKAALEVFHRHGVSLKHIESHPSRNFEWEHDFIAEAKGPDGKVTEAVIAELQQMAKNVHLIGDFNGSPNPSTNYPKAALS